MYRPEKFESEFEKLIDSEIGIDDAEKVASKIRDSDEILFLADNCGEIMLDQILLEKINELGTKVFIGAKSEPVQEDLTVEVGKDLGLEKYGEIISTGKKVGIFPKDASRELLEKLEEADLILAKGMGNFETISEFESDLSGRLTYLLRAKCRPVAESLGVKRGKLTIKLA